MDAAEEKDASTPVFAPASLLVIAARTAALNADALLLDNPAELDELPEETVLLILAMVMKRMKLTVPLAKVFLNCRHEHVVEYVSKLDLFAGYMPIPMSSCRI